MDVSESNNDYDYHCEGQDHHCPSSDSTTHQATIRLYKRRFLLLVLLTFSIVLCNFQSVQYTSFANVVTKYYNLSPPTVAAIGSIDNGIYFLSVYHGTKLVDYIGFRHSCVIGTLIVNLSCILKCFSTYPNCFLVALFSQVVLGLGESILFATGPLLPAIWFSQREVATVNTILSSARCLGCALTFVAQYIWFSDPHPNVQRGLAQLSIILSSLATLIFVSMVFFGREKPPTPPSLAQKAKEFISIEYKFSDLFKQRSYLLLCLSASISTGVYLTLVTTINQAINASFPGETHLVSVAGILLTSLPIVSGPLHGAWLDRSKRFRRIALISYLSAFASVALLYFALVSGSFHCLLIGIVLVSLVLSGFDALSLDMAVELSYPHPESRSVGALTCATFIAVGIMSPIASKLILVIGTTKTFGTFIPLLFIGLLCLLAIRWDLKRENAECGKRLLKVTSTMSVEQAT